MIKFVFLASIVIMACGLESCGGGRKTEAAGEEALAAEEVVVNEYKLTEGLPSADWAAFPEEAGGWRNLFDGKTLAGWRGYNRPDLPGRWTVDEEAIHIRAAREEEKGAGRNDILFARKFRNFELEFEWKVAKGANSGVFFYIQEVEGQPSYISAPEYQILDNENHPDAGLGKDGNRMSASLYDMIAAKPQNARPYGEWNTGKILCFKGTIVHYQNEVPVVEYHLWTSQWKKLLNAGKFAKEKWPLAYELLTNCGGNNQEGYIGLQDHGDDVWFRRIRIKLIE
ncbi:MAG: DUF1080 domain-containing protein [Tannerellaceae bacterium]|jgi:hypothetical protein|nr:DUF1080 domain-containing protein [Tannerellaceae bacterium]